jgi:hypothetical protein
LIRKYNAAELRCLVSMMDKVRDAIRAIGLRITRWDGAGAVSGAMLAKHGIKDHMAPSPPDVFDAACCAYSGGHIEACKLGHYDGTVHHYDINSAYPDQFRFLPSLVSGAWQHGDGVAEKPLSGFTIVRLQYRFYPGLPFYPLFYRENDGSIKYPERGHGWYWFPEFDAARVFAEKFGSIEFRVMEWWHFKPSANSSPFLFIEDYYAARQSIVEETRRTGIPNGAEKMLKLGYNGCYGKTVQQVGARIVDGELHQPAFFQIEWGGYVTAGCRAKLMLAAMQKPNAIISFATDGLFSTEPLNLYCPTEKILGAWEYQQHQGMTIVMPGVYWLFDEKKGKKHVDGYSRGFDKKTMEDADFVHAVWKRGEGEIDIKSTRMVTLGTACMSDTFWDMRGCFVETTRNLRLTGYNAKRHALPLSDKFPHRKLYNTYPRDIDEDYSLSLENLGSAPYPVAWLQSKPEDAREADGVAEVNDADRSFFFDFEAVVLA